MPFGCEAVIKNVRTGFSFTFKLTDTFCFGIISSNAWSGLAFIFSPSSYTYSGIPEVKSISSRSPVNCKYNTNGDYITLYVIPNSAWIDKVFVLKGQYSSITPISSTDVPSDAIDITVKL